MIVLKFFLITNIPCITTCQSIPPRVIFSHRSFKKDSTILNEKKSVLKKPKQIHNKKCQNNVFQFDNIVSKTVNNVKLLSNEEKNLSESKINAGDSVLNWPIYRVNPVYPDQAKLLKIEGEITVIYDINIMGKVENIRIVYSSVPKIFDSSVYTAMRRWVYEIKKPKRDLTMVFRFSLREIKKFKK